MTTPSRENLTPNDPAYPPVAAATWQTSFVDARSVQDALDRLWSQAEMERRPRSGDGHQESSEGSLMRASTVNLIVLCDTAAAAADIADTIGHLTEFCPSRAVILVTHGPQREDELTVRAAVHERALSKSRPPIRYETVTVMANGHRASSLANIASALLVPELPDFLWWHTREIESHPLFDELTDVSDRLIVDTTLLDGTGCTLRLLSRLAAARRAELRLSDLTWARLTPWRQLVAQFFDVPDARASLQTIEELVIAYSELDDAPSGLPSALLCAGWIASRLDWKAPGEMVRSREGWRVTLRAGTPGLRREVILRLNRTSDPASQESVRAIHLIANGVANGAFSVERIECDALVTHGEIGDAPPVSRLVHTRPNDPTTLLSNELRVFGRDAVYEEALAFAAGLLPDGEAG